MGLLHKLSWLVAAPRNDGHKAGGLRKINLNGRSEIINDCIPQAS